ncbi:MAG: hypothetical protein KDA05_09465 [Phycisphaerales bacterium]|nr:hypothetical protein [Phycisphaerales bacterium]
MSSMWKVMALVGVVLMACFSGGCSSKPRMGRYTIEVSLDPSLASSARVPTIDVDLVAVQPANEAQWEAYDLGGYFAASDALRMGAVRHAMQFGPGNTAPQSLGAGDDMWGSPSWSGARKVYVLANLPGGPQRLTIPLDTRHWEGGNRSTIRVQVQSASISLLTQQQPLPVE